jgi:nucleoporin NUP2
VPKSEEKEGTPASGEDSNTAEGVDASKPIFAAEHDEEGAGEEDEETTHTIRAKVYRLLRNKDGANYWADTGVGMLRLKKHTQTSTRRMLLRNSSTGKILIVRLLFRAVLQAFY